MEKRTYIKKPVVVEAYQVEEETIIKTVHGEVVAPAGSYVINDVAGDIYISDREKFEAMFRLAK